MDELTNCELEPLRQDAEFALARVVRLNGLPSCLLVSPVLEQPAPSSLVKLENAFAVRDELDASWAARPLELLTFRGRLALAIEDPGGEFLDQRSEGPLAVPEFLRLAIGIASSLAGLHGKGLVHKDVKPANVIANAKTDDAWLTGFSLATRLPRHRQSAETPEVIAGTLAYMAPEQTGRMNRSIEAPEQTGRMNRSIDSRSDLYSLGVTFYEMLVGALPFTASDPMEWVHCHIARLPISPCLRRNDVPEPLSAIILRLVAKAPEDRYQTAAGVEADLRRCISDLEAHGRIEAFPLGARDVLEAAAGQIQQLDYFYYTALSVSALCETASADQQQAWRELLTAHREQLSEWAKNYPPTFGDKHALVSAEIARLEGRDADAMRLYEQAIRSAREHGFVKNEAVAHEVAARFYAARGFETIADTYLRNARYCYLRWGADGKVRQLDRLHSHLAAPKEQRPASLNATVGTPVGELDAETVARASQALSSEIVLPKLIERLMRLALEHAGAERGLLILLRGSEPQIEAEATTSHGRVDVQVRPSDIASSDLPKSALQYVIRTHERVVLDDASLRNLYSDDEYLARKKAKSVICLPIVKQAKLVGVLYLENNLTPQVFTSGRMAVLDMLASQAAISLENARLYAALEQELTERKRAEEELRRNETALREAQAELAHVARVTTMGELTASIAHEVRQPIAGVLVNGNACLRWLGRVQEESDNLVEARAALQRIIRDGNRAGEIIARIRALFQKTATVKEPLNLNETIQDIIVLAKSEIDKQRVTLRLEMSPGLPNVLGDRVQLQQVLLNLILNAIDAMATIQGRARDLVIRTQSSEEREALVTVRDSGLGLQPESVETVFKAFHTTKPSGLGMGLSISRSIVENHSGRLWASAHEGPGASFHFALPTVQELNCSRVGRENENVAPGPSLGAAHKRP